MMMKISILDDKMDLLFRLLRANGCDDIITIRKRMNGTYLLRYTDGNMPNHVWVSEKENHEIMLYLQVTLTFFKNDPEPFSRLQVSIPGHPVISTSQASFTSSLYEDLIAIIEEHIYKPARSFTH
jgi:hypothetical protein